MRVDTHAILHKRLCPQSYLDKLEIKNPKYTKNVEMGYSTNGIPKYIRLYQEKDELIKIPRNVKLPDDLSHDDLEDNRIEGEDVEFNSSIEPRDYQKEPIDKLVETEDGILVAGAGRGKTVMAIDALARVGKPVLILVHKGFLMEQWEKEIKKFLDEDEVGIVRGNKWHWKGQKIVIGMIQTLYSKIDQYPKGFAEQSGLIIADEVHRISAPTFSRVIQQFPAKRRWGLTATPERADGLEVVFHAHLGGIIANVEGESLEPNIYMKSTGVSIKKREYLARNNKPNIPKLVTALTEVKKRNKIILRYLKDATLEGRKILLLTGRVAHTKKLKKSFDAHMKKIGEDITTSLYIGDMNKSERQKAEKADVLFATMQIAKEGLDIPDLDTLFFATPTGSKITTQQAVGRILRLSDGKKDPIVVDFVDDNIGICRGLAGKRKNVYRDLGYEYERVN